MDPVIAISVIVIVVRLVVPLTILRWPLAGAVACVIADTYDWVVFSHFGFGLFANGHYQFYDKILDTWYLAFALWIVFDWKNHRARTTAIVLFVWRFVGFAVFETTGWRLALVLAPNVFEEFYFFWLIILKWFPKFQLTRRALVVILVLIGIPKVGEELVLHSLDTGFLGFIRSYL